MTEPWNPPRLWCMGVLGVSTKYDVGVTGVGAYEREAARSMIGSGGGVSGQCSMSAMIETLSMNLSLGLYFRQS